MIEKLRSWLKSRKFVLAPKNAFLVDLLDVIASDNFVSKTVNIDPYFYADIIGRYNRKAIFHHRLSHQFLTALFENRNEKFFEEVRKSYDRNDVMDDLPILKSFLSNMKLFEENELWQPPMIRGKYILWRLSPNDFLFQVFEYPQGYEDDFWKLEITNIIQFINMVMRVHINRMGRHHLWLFAYSRFAEIILKRIPKRLRNIDWTKEFPINGLYIVDHFIIWNLRAWLDLCYEINNSHVVASIIDCYAQILSSITSNHVISDSYKIKAADDFLTCFADLYHYANEDRDFEDAVIQHENRETVDQVRINFIKNIQRPPYGKDEQYFRILRAAWEGFDREPYDWEVLTRLDEVVGGLI